MKRTSIYIAILSFLICSVFGCSSTKIITPNTSFMLSERAALITTNGAKLGTRLIKTEGDSIFAQDYTFTRNVHFHFSEVQKVVVKDHKKGAKQGFWRGAVGGAIWGFFAGGKEPDDPLGNRGAGAYIGGVFGGAIGAVIGTAIGKTDTYLFEETKDGIPAPEKFSNANTKQDSVIHE